VEQGVWAKCPLGPCGAFASKKAKNVVRGTPTMVVARVRKRRNDRMSPGPPRQPATLARL